MAAKNRGQPLIQHPAQLSLFSISLHPHSISEMGPAIIPTSQMRTVCLRKVKSCTQGCLAGRGQGLEPEFSP